MAGASHPPFVSRLAEAIGSPDAIVLPLDGLRGAVVPEAPPRAIVVDGDLSTVRRSALAGLAGRLRSLEQSVAIAASVAPSAVDRAATLLPPATWAGLFEAAGFSVRRQVDLREGGAAGRWGGTWTEVDPFRLAGVGRLGFVLDPTPVAPHDRTRSVRSLVGPQRQLLRAPGAVGLLIAGYQDLHNLMPWLEAIDPRDLRVILGQGVGERDAAAADDLEAACGAHDVQVVRVTPASDRGLEDLDVRVLLSASESSVNSVHLGNAVTLLRARSLGWATGHVQHGIWPRAEFPPPIGTCADVVLAWSDEYGEVIGTADHEFAVVGGMRFDRYTDAPPRTAAAVYGSWTARFDRHVVVATNLHWREHDTAIDALAVVGELASRDRSTLFTLKSHPYELIGPGKSELPNVVVLSEPVMLAAGLDPGDVIESADLVVCTPSTFALEATLAGKPCFVIDTGNPSRHRFVEYRPLSDLPGWLDDEERRSCCQPLYGTHYCEPSTRGRALDLSLGALARVMERRRPIVPSAASGVARALYGLYAEAARDAGQLRHDFQTASEYARSLVTALEEKDRYIERLRKKLNEPESQGKS